MPPQKLCRQIWDQIPRRGLIRPLSAPFLFCTSGKSLFFKTTNSQFYRMKHLQTNSFPCRLSTNICWDWASLQKHHFSGFGIYEMFFSLEFQQQRFVGISFDLFYPSFSSNPFKHRPRALPAPPPPLHMSTLTGQICYLVSDGWFYNIITNDLAFKFCSCITLKIKWLIKI